MNHTAMRCAYCRTAYNRACEHCVEARATRIIATALLAAIAPEPRTVTSLRRAELDADRKRFDRERRVTT